MCSSSSKQLRKRGVYCLLRKLAEALALHRRDVRWNTALTQPHGISFLQQLPLLLVQLLWRKALRARNVLDLLSTLDFLGDLILREVELHGELLLEPVPGDMRDAMRLHRRLCWRWSVGGQQIPGQDSPSPKHADSSENEQEERKPACFPSFLPTLRLAQQRGLDLLCRLLFLILYRFVCLRFVLSSFVVYSVMFAFIYSYRSASAGEIRAAWHAGKSTLAPVTSMLPRRIQMIGRNGSGKFR